MSETVTDIASMNIYQKLAKIRKLVEVIKKNKRSYTSSYVSEDEILAKVTAGLDKYHLIYYPQIFGGEAELTPYHYVKTKRAKNGDTIEEHVNEIMVKCPMSYVWVNTDKPEERVEVPWLLAGQQTDASQAVGSGLTYLHRYFLLKFFQASTVEDDPDHWRGKQAEAEHAEEKAIVAGLIEEISKVVTTYMESEGSDKAKLAEVVKKYAVDDKGKPSANYLKHLRTADAASGLLKDLNKMIEGGEKK